MTDYKSLLFQRDIVKNVFRLTILTLMVLTTLFSLWAAFVFSRRLTRPVRDLVEGTLAVAAGDLDKKIPVSERDDFSMLALSFNTMTKRLSDTRAEREQARRQLQQEHDYLHVVLEHLSSGVITLDETALSAGSIPPPAIFCGTRCWDRSANPSPNSATTCRHCNPFLDMVQTHWQDMQTGHEWQSEITLNTDKGRLILVCRGASLPVGVIRPTRFGIGI